MSYRERQNRKNGGTFTAERLSDGRLLVPEPIYREYQDALDRYRRFEEDEYLLEDAPHVGEDDD